MLQESCHPAARLRTARPLASDHLSVVRSDWQLPSARGFRALLRRACCGSWMRAPTWKILNHNVGSSQALKRAHVHVHTCTHKRARTHTTRTQGRQTQRPTDRQTDRQTDRRTDARARTRARAHARTYPRVRACERRYLKHVCIATHQDLVYSCLVSVALREHKERMLAHTTPEQTCPHMRMDAQVPPEQSCPHMRMNAQVHA